MIYQVCVYLKVVCESISNTNDNFLNGDYCFLEDGYSETKPSESSNSV